MLVSRAFLSAALKLELLLVLKSARLVLSVVACANVERRHAVSAVKCAVVFVDVVNAVA